MYNIIINGMASILKKMIKTIETIRKLNLVLLFAHFKLLNFKEKRGKSATSKYEKIMVIEISIQSVNK